MIFSLPETKGRGRCMAWERWNRYEDMNDIRGRKLMYTMTCNETWEMRVGRSEGWFACSQRQMEGNAWVEVM